MHHVGGGDRLPPFHVPYSEPTRRPTGLDWDAMRPDTTTPAEVEAAKQICPNCTRHVDSISRYTGLCPACELERDPHNQEAPPTQESTMTTPTTVDVAPIDETPDYIREFTDLLIVTEGHADPLVRSIRKIVTQGALALRSAHDASHHTSGSDAIATAHTPSATGSTSPSEPEAPITQQPTQGERLKALGVTSQQVRQWALENHVRCSPRGRFSNHVLTAYEDAHPTSDAA